jgi:hypothetical protein
VGFVARCGVTSFTSVVPAGRPVGRRGRRSRRALGRLFLGQLRAALISRPEPERAQSDKEKGVAATMGIAQQSPASGARSTCDPRPRPMILMAAMARSRLWSARGVEPASTASRSRATPFRRWSGRRVLDDVDGLGRPEAVSQLQRVRGGAGAWRSVNRRGGQFLAPIDVSGAGRFTVSTSTDAASQRSRPACAASSSLRSSSWQSHT